VLESYVTKRGDRKAALKFLKKTMKGYGNPHVIVMDKLRSYGAAMREIGNAKKQEAGRWLNNWGENSHQLFRRRERALLGFRSMRSLEKFSAVHASVHNHFNLERHLYSRYSRAIFKLNRNAAIAEWRQLGVAQGTATLSLQRRVLIRLTPPSDRLPAAARTGSRSARHGGFDRRANLWPVPCRPGIRRNLAT